MGRKSLGYFDCRFRRSLGSMTGFARVICGAVALSLRPSAALVAQPTPKRFTLQQVMSAPFNSDLIAAPVKNRFAWISYFEGRRNIWVAEPSGDGYTSRAITNYTHDDGQEISGLQWSPDADSIVYVRGSDPYNAKNVSQSCAATARCGTGRVAGLAGWQRSAQTWSRQFARFLYPRRRCRLGAGWADLVSLLE